MNVLNDNGHSQLLHTTIKRQNMNTQHTVRNKWTQARWCGLHNELLISQQINALHSEIKQNPFPFKNGQQHWSTLQWSKPHGCSTVYCKVGTSRGLCNGRSAPPGVCARESAPPGVCAGESAPPGVCAMEGRHLQGSVQWRVGTSRGPCNGESAPPGVRAMESRHLQGSVQWSQHLQGSVQWSQHLQGCSQWLTVNPWFPGAGQEPTPQARRAVTSTTRGLIWLQPITGVAQTAAPAILLCSTLSSHCHVLCSTIKLSSHCRVQYP